MSRSASRRRKSDDMDGQGTADEPVTPGSYERAVSRLWRYYENYLDSQCSRYGVRGSCIPLLMYLWDGNVGVTQNQIAHALGVDKGTVSRNVRSLVSAGLIVQEACQRDSRACSIDLTEEGRKMAEPIMDVAHRWTSTVTAGMTEKQRQRMLGQLREMGNRAAEFNSLRARESYES